MNLLSRLANKLKGSGPEREPIAAKISFECHNVTLKPALSDTDIEVLRALRMIHRESPTHSFSLKLYPGKLDGVSGRVVCQYCIMRRCRDYEPGLVAVHHAKKLKLFGCDLCRTFLIRIDLSS
jgi:hypothetical protein